MKLRDVALLAIVLGGCSPTQRSLRRAAKAMEECDLRAAHTEFDDAWTRSPDHLDAAMGFALTDLVLLPEDKDLNRGLLELGFAHKVDAEDLLYGDHALLDLLASGADCDMLDELAQDELAYPPFWDEGDPSELVGRDTTVADLLEHLSAMTPRLQRLADAFEAAGDQLEGPYELELGGSCGAGLGEVALQAPELYGTAALLTATRASIVAARGYDWDLNLRVVFDGPPEERIELYNEHLLRVTDRGELEEAGAILQDALVLADRALEEAASVEEEVANAVIDWSELDRDFVDDLRSLGDAALASLEQGSMEEIPFWSPPLQADVGSLFRSPPDTAELDGPLFRLAADDDLEVHEERLKSLFVDRFDRDIFDSDGEEWTVGERWENLDLLPVFDPDERYSKSYSCD